MIVPSARTLIMAVLAIPAALVIAAGSPEMWAIVPAAVVALLVLMLLDGLLAGVLADWKLEVARDAEVGEPLSAKLLAEIGGRVMGGLPDAAISFDPRLGEGGRATCRLEPDPASGIFAGTFELAPSRRGTGTIESLWLRWPGPLGLAHRQTKREIGQEVRVWPDLAPVRSPVLQTFLRDSQFGIIARRIRGEGTQFESLSEYEPGMDRRRIDWKSSARQTRLLARENESERNNQIVFAFDCGQAMCEPLDGLPRIDRAVSAALTASYVALKGGDRVALFGFAQRPDLLTPFAADSRHFHRLQTAAASLDYSSGEPNFTLALATLAARLKRRSMVVLFSDFTDPTSAEMMIESVARLVQRHIVLFVTMRDTELEALTSAPPDTVIELASAVTADSLARQRALVLQRLRRLGVDVIEAPWNAITYDLIDRYLAAKRAGTVG